MIIDVLVTLIALVSIANGYRSGMLSQLLNLFVLAGAFIFTRSYQDRIETSLSGFFEIDGALATTLALIVGWTLSYFFLGLIRNSFLRRWRRKQPQQGGMDRILGALFGSAKSGFVLYLTLAVILMAKSQISNALPQIADALEHSRIAQAVSQYNLLESQRAHELAPTEVRALTKIMRLAGDPTLAERLKTDPEAQKKARELVEFLQEKKPELMDSIREGDLSALAHNKDLMELLKDPELLKRIEGFPE